MSIVKSNQNLTKIAAGLASKLQLSIKAQPYTAEISRANPTAFVFLIDQSGSMKGDLERKLAQTINKLFNELIITCKRSDGIGDYADLLLIGYGTEDEANIAWEGNLQGRDWVKVSELIDNHASEEEIEVEIITRSGTRTELQKQFQWVIPRSEGRTPMRSAFKLTTTHLANWIEQHPNNFPPIVFNITDGEPTDGDHSQMLIASKELRDLHTSDGFVILFNIHITKDSSKEVFLPSKKSELSNVAAQNLFDYSSELPEAFMPRLADMLKGKMQDTHVAMSYNANLDTLWRILQIGTRTTNR